MFFIFHWLKCFYFSSTKTFWIFGSCVTVSCGCNSWKKGRVMILSDWVCLYPPQWRCPARLWLAACFWSSVSHCSCPASFSPWRLVAVSAWTAAPQPVAAPLLTMSRSPVRITLPPSAMPPPAPPLQVNKDGYESDRKSMSHSAVSLTHHPYSSSPPHPPLPLPLSPPQCSALLSSRFPWWRGGGQRSLSEGVEGGQRWGGR